MEKALEALKKQCQIKPIKSFKDLSIGFHEVVGVEIVETEFGKKVRVELGDSIMFLPERIKMSPEEVKELCEYATGSTGKLFLNYMGRNGEKKNSAILLDFEKMDMNSLTQDVFSTSPPPPTQAL